MTLDMMDNFEKAIKHIGHTSHDGGFLERSPDGYSYYLNRETQWQYKLYVKAYYDGSSKNTANENKQKRGVDMEDIITKTLEEREKKYGSFQDHAFITQQLKEMVFEAKPREQFTSSDQVEALEMILHKIARIVNGDDNYADNWIDIAGYAKLVADRLSKETLSS